MQDTPRDCEIGELQKLEASIGREDKPMGKMQSRQAVNFIESGDILKRTLVPGKFTELDNLLTGGRGWMKLLHVSAPVADTGLGLKDA